MWQKLNAHLNEEVVSYLLKTGNTLPTLFIIPGMLSVAEDYTPIFNDVKNPAIIIESPLHDNCNDLSFEGQVKRINGLLEKLAIKKYFLIGHSVGGALATMVAYSNDKIQKLLIIDYIPVYPKVSEDWQKRAIEQNEPMVEVIKRYVGANKQVDVRQEFSKLTIPIYILKAELSNYLSDDICGKTALLNPKTIVTEIKGCDHDLQGEVENFKQIISSLAAV